MRELSAPVIALLALGLLTVSHGAGWATVRTTITLNDSADQDSAVDQSTNLGDDMKDELESTFGNAYPHGDDSEVFAYVSKGESNTDVVASVVIKVPTAQDSAEASSNVSAFLDNNPDVLTSFNNTLSASGHSGAIASFSTPSATASASQMATFMAAIKLGKPEYQVTMRNNMEAVKQAVERAVYANFPFVSVSKLEMAPVFVDFVAATMKAEVHGAENAEVAKMIYQEHQGGLDDYDLNEELERNLTGTGLPSVPEREEGEPSYVQQVYSRMLLGVINGGEGSGDTTVSGVIQVNNSRIVDGMVGNGYVLAPFKRLMVQASRAFPAVDFLGAGLTKGSTDKELKAEVALRVYGVQSNEDAAAKVRGMWNTNKALLEKYANDLLNSVSGSGIGYEQDAELGVKSRIQEFLGVTFNPGQDVSRYTVDGGDAVVTGTVQMREAYRERLFKGNATHPTTYPRVWGVQLAMASLIAGADPDLYVKGVKITEGSGDNINVRALITVRDTEGNTAAEDAIQSLLNERPITKELLNAGILEEFGLPPDDDEWVSGVGSVTVAAGPEQETLSMTTQLSGVIGNIFNEDDYNDKSEAYRTFKRNFEADAEARVSQDCACSPQVTITSVTFDGPASRKLQSSHEVSVTSEVNGASQSDVNAALDPSNGNLTLGGATVTNVELEVKQNDSDGPNHAGRTMGCSALLAFMVGLAAMLA